MGDTNVKRNYKDTVFNVNFGQNAELMEACRMLKEYAQYVKIVRENAEKMELREAVEKAVDDCIRNGILRDFLKKNRAEAIAMSIFEYDEERLSIKEGHETDLWPTMKSRNLTDSLLFHCLKGRFVIISYIISISIKF